MPAIYQHPLQVPASSIDEQGHVNNLEYLHWMQDAALAHSAAQGWPTERYLQLGAPWVARSHRVDYLKPAFLDDSIVVLTWVADFRKVRSLRQYKIVRAGETSPLVIAETDWAFVDLQQRVPRRVPEIVQVAFEVVSAENRP